MTPKPRKHLWMQMWKCQLWLLPIYWYMFRNVELLFHYVKKATGIYFRWRHGRQPFHPWLSTHSRGQKRKITPFKIAKRSFLIIEVCSDALSSISLFSFFHSSPWQAFLCFRSCLNKRYVTHLEILQEGTGDSTRFQDICIFLFFDQFCQKDCNSGLVLLQFRCAEELLGLCFQSIAVDGPCKCAAGNNSDTENTGFLDTAN